MTRALHPQVERAVTRYLKVADRQLPDKVVGLYVVGSSALGAYRPNRSDIDLVVVIDGRLDERELRRARRVQIVANAPAGVRCLLTGRIAFPTTCNASFVSTDDLARPVTEIEPIASHVAVEFRAGTAFDVNPVMWKLFQEHGIAVRGAEPSELGLQPEPDRLVAWNLENLQRYWRAWGEKAARGRAPMSPLLPSRWVASWGILGAPRLHRTIATGEVVAKDEAGRYALDAFDQRWHPAIEAALATSQGRHDPNDNVDRRQRYVTAGEFVLEVVRSAEQLAATVPPEPTPGGAPEPRD